MLQLEYAIRDSLCQVLARQFTPGSQASISVKANQLFAKLEALRSTFVHGCVAKHQTNAQSLCQPGLDACSPGRLVLSDVMGAGVDRW